MSDILIVYYSRSGRTRLVAEQLGSILSADVVELTERKDRSGAMGYLTAGKDAMFKHDAELTSSPGVGAHKVIIVGMPVWAFQPPPAIRTWLKRTDLRGCKVCAFCTMDGSGAERTFTAISTLLSEPLAATLAVIKPREDDPELQKKLTEWAKSLPRI